MVFSCGHVGMELVGEDPQHVAADVVAEYEVGLRGVDGRLELLRLRPVHALAAREAHQPHRAVGEPLADLGPLRRVERHFDAVGVVQ